MNKFILLFFGIFIFQTAKSQEIYLNLGKNFTSYDFKNSDGQVNSDLKSSNGNSYEIGYFAHLDQSKISYALGIALNEYNAIGGDTANSYSWNTEYLGLQGRLSYSIIDSGRSNFDIIPNFGLNAATLISGKQQISSTYYDLTKENEFSGLILTPSAGIELKYGLSSSGFLSLGYNYCKGFNLSNSTDQKLSFNTHQLQFGVHFNIN